MEEDNEHINQLNWQIFLGGQNVFDPLVWVMSLLLE